MAGNQRVGRAERLWLAKDEMARLEIFDICVGDIELTTGPVLNQRIAAKVILKDICPAAAKQTVIATATNQGSLPPLPVSLSLPPLLQISLYGEGTVLLTNITPNQITESDVDFFCWT